MKRIRWTGYVVLILTTIVWGTTFTVTKSSMTTVPPLYFLAWRFSFASLALLLLNIRRLGSITRSEWKGGLTLGLTMTAGFVAQTVGLVYSTASKGGFITGLAVVLVPLLGALLFRRRLSPRILCAVLVAATGLALLSLDFDAGLRLNRGDIWLFACALSFALNILFLGIYAPRCRVTVLSFTQVTFVGINCWLATLILEQPVPISGSLWAGIIYLGLFATVFTTIGQAWGQRIINPERAALVFTLEPVFAALFAMVLLGERLSSQGLVGSGLILAGIVIAELASVRGKHVKAE